MRVLWVEDQLDEEKKADWFGNLHRYKDIEIIVSNDYEKASVLLDESIRLYDLIVLDIDLEESILSEKNQNYAWHNYGLDLTKFLKEAGFHLFIKLIEIGFPKERIVFLTGNVSVNTLRNKVESFKEAFISDDIEGSNKLLNDVRREVDEKVRKKIDEIVNTDNIEKKKKREDLLDYLNEIVESKDTNNTYDKFIKRFKHARIIPPKAIKKGPKTKEELSEWANTYLTKEYSVLRRGIIDGCHYISNKLDKSSEPEKTIQLNKYCDPNVKKLNIDSAKDYLMSLERLLPIKVIEKEKQAIFRLLLRSIAHEWETAIHPSNLKKNLSIKEKHKDYEWLSALGYVMKATRNMISHSNNLQNVNVSDCAFLFMINCRAMFLLDCNLEHYEEELFWLFKIEKLVECDDLKEKIKIEHTSLRKLHCRQIGKSKVNGKVIENRIKSEYYYKMILDLSELKDSPDINYVGALYIILFTQLFYKPINDEYKIQFKESSSITTYWKKKYIEKFYCYAFHSVDETVNES